MRELDLVHDSWSMEYLLGGTVIDCLVLAKAHEYRSFENIWCTSRSVTGRASIGSQNHNARLLTLSTFVNPGPP